MNLAQQIQDISSKATKWLVDANTTFNNALIDITAQPNAYTADKLTKDISTTGANFIRVLMALWPVADPTLPTAAMTNAAATLPGLAGVVASATLARSVDPTIQPTVTNLVFLGLPNAAVPVPVGGFPPIPMRNVPNTSPNFLDGGLRQQVSVEVDGAAILAAPQRGIYQGYVLVGTDPVAVVVLRAT